MKQVKDCKELLPLIIKVYLPTKSAPNASHGNQPVLAIITGILTDTET